MKKSDLHTGMIVKLRNGKFKTVLFNVCIDNICNNIDLFVGENGFLRLENYNENLTCSNADKYDVMEVFKQKEDIAFGVKEPKAGNLGKTLWKRKEARKMTVSEICEKLGYNIEIIKEER